MDTGAGRLVLKVPGIVEGIEDMLSMRVKVEGDRVVTFSAVASVRRGFKDPEGYARVGGLAAVTLEVKKRVGANIIDTIARVREIVETGRRRLRPVFLTAFTTVLGLMPVVLAMNIDLIGRSISCGAPSTQWSTQLASAIAGGLSFATVLTLVLAPCLLVLGESMGELSRRLAGRLVTGNRSMELVASETQQARR